jgi:A/G-specific adenine glycosylase
MDHTRDSPTPETTHRLLAWFFRNRRELPWREESDPYRIWVSEVMLQQTRAQTVEPYYRRFLELFPDPASLAAAGEREVLKAWEGLGYYGRARRLQEAAREIMRLHGGSFPSEPEAARSLPGVGPYTAAAVLSIAFARRLAVVDGNVLRVVTRLTADVGDPAAAAVRARVREYVENSFCHYHPGWVNQAWMELGALVCRPAPDCPSCPLASACRALLQGRTAELPARRPRTPLPVRRGFLYLLVSHGTASGLLACLTAALHDGEGGGAGAVLRDQEVPLLLVRRPSRGLLGGLWELPNAEESEEEAFRLANGIVCLGATGQEVRHTYSHFKVSFRPLLGRLAREAVLERWAEQRWVAPGQLDRYPRSGVTIKALEL